VWVSRFALVLALAGCDLGDLGLPSDGTTQCLRMSDCEAPFKCVEGTCRSNEALGAATATDAGVTDAAASDQ
jgi:hypothetical protein